MEQIHQYVVLEQFSPLNPSRYFMVVRTADFPTIEQMPRHFEIPNYGRFNSKSGAEDKCHALNNHPTNRRRDDSGVS